MTIKIKIDTKRKLGNDNLFLDVDIGDSEIVIN